MTPYRYADGPDFLIIGAPRSGTTYLAKNLAAHPGVCLVQGEEDYAAGDLHYFDINTPRGRENHARGLSWYRTQFSACSPNTVCGEKTADYLPDPDAARLICDAFGDTVRCVAVLRDPVARAVSHYWHSRHRLPLGLSLEALVDDGRDVNDVWVLAAGRYGECLARYDQCLGEERVLVVIQDDLERDPEGEMQRVCHFLGVDEAFVFPHLRERVNAGSSSAVSHWVARVGNGLRARVPAVYRWLVDGPASSAIKQAIRVTRGKAGAANDAPLDQAGHTITPAVREALRAYYRDDVRALGERLQRDLEALWWGRDRD